MPFVEIRKNGAYWTSKKGAEFGLKNGMGSAGRQYRPGQIHRSDRMAEQGLYADGEKGIPRLTNPTLRLEDQARDGVQGEVLYGVLGAAMRLNDDEACEDMLRIYNEWLADFCETHPSRFAGIASIPSHSVLAATAEIERVAKRGVVRGVEIAHTHEMDPLFHPIWKEMWATCEEAQLPIHFHTVGQPFAYNQASLKPLQRRQAFAVHITGFQMAMSKVVMEIIYGGVLEAHPELIVVIGEAGIGWIPYLLEHMDLEWTDQFADLELTMKPSEYWRRQCHATYQSDPIGLRLLDIIGENNVMWGSDFPHPDGIWPDSQDFIKREFANLSNATRRKITCENAMQLYGFSRYAT